MSTTEALRTQLDALQSDYNRIEAENQRLREANSLETAVIELEKELVQSQEENVRLVQELNRLQEESAHLDDDRRAAHVGIVEELRAAVETMGGLEETITAMGGETTQLKVALVEKETQLETERTARQQATRRAESAVEVLVCLGEELEAARTAAELGKLRAITEENKEWEKREARLLRQIEDLEDRIASLPWRSNCAMAPVPSGHRQHLCNSYTEKPLVLYYGPIALAVQALCKKG